MNSFIVVKVVERLKRISRKGTTIAILELT